MKVVQTVFAKFHHFDLARQLHRRRMLEAIFTGYPRWKLGHEDLPANKIRTFPWIETFLMGKARFGLQNAWLDRELNWLMAQTLDAHVASHLPECDVFVGISGAGLKTSRVAKRRGTRYFCDRGSSHVRFGEQLLDEEFKRWGQVFPGSDPRALAKEECEYEAADVITVPSRFCLRSFEEMGVPAEKLRKVPYGVELSRFDKVGEPPADTFEVLFVGQVSFRKGVPYLLRAFEQLKHPHKRLRLAGVAQREMRAYLRDRKSNADVDFLGPVSQSQVVELMSTSHVLVLPSIEDGFGLVLGQAMACGCPVVYSTNTGGEELSDHGKEGFLVPIRDAAAITNRLDQFCQDVSLQRQMGEAGMKKVRKLGGWDSYGNGYATLLGKTANPMQGTDVDVALPYHSLNEVNRIVSL
jgi:alpha-maltose-1-phosphate synthase